MVNTVPLNGDELNQGTSMNTGYNNYTDIMSVFTKQLKDSFASLETTLKGISQSVGGQKQLLEDIFKNSKNSSKDFERFTRSNDDFLRNFIRTEKRPDTYNVNKELKKLLESMTSQLKSASTSRLINESRKSTDVRSGLDNVKISETSKIYQNYEKVLESLISELKTVSGNKSHFGSLSSGIQINQDSLQGYQNQLKTLTEKLNSGTATDQDKQLILELNKKIESTSSQLDSDIEEIKAILKDFEDRFKENGSQTRESLNAISESFEDLERLQSVTDEKLAKVAELSPSFANLLKKQQKQSYNEQFTEVVSNAKTVLEKTIQTLQERISSAQGEEKETLEKQLKIAKQQEKHLNNMDNSVKSGLKSVWGGFAKSSAGVLLNTFSGLITGFVDGLQNRYLDTYVEGFDRVYGSIENTRNSISARLKLDQGGFEDIQQSIKNEIDARGLSGSLSLVDINDALVALSSAGITDKTTLQELAIESAKLTAQGSSINLQNEETITNLLAQINRNQQQGMDRQSALDSAVSMLDSLDSTVQMLRDEYGQDIALVNGGIDTIINEQLSRGKAFNLTNEQVSQNLQEAIIAATSLQSYAIDPQTLSNIERELLNLDITNASPFQQVLFEQYGLDPANLGNLSVAEQNERVLQWLQEIGQSASTLNELAPVLSAYGISNYTPEEFMNIVRNASNIQVRATKDQTDAIDDLTKKVQEDLSRGTYMSATERVNTEYENKMTSMAIKAEQYYEGGEIVHKQLENVNSGIKSIIQLLQTALVASGASMFKGWFGGGTAKLPTNTQPTITGGSAFPTKTTPTLWGGVRGNLGSDIGTGRQGGSGNITADFLTGARGTTAGLAGRGLGVGLGAMELGTSFYNNIQRDESGNIVWSDTMADVFNDPSTYRGLGTGIVSAVGGPLAGMIVGETWAQASKFGKWLGEEGLGTLDPIEDFFQKYSDTLLDAANKLEESAVKTLESSEAQLRTFDEMSVSQKKDRLLGTQLTEDQQKLLNTNKQTIDAQMLLTLKEEDVNNLFKDVVVKQYEQQQKQAELDLQRAHMQQQTALGQSGFAESIYNLRKNGVNLSDIDTSTMGGHGRTYLQSAFVSAYGTEGMKSIFDFADTYKEANPNVNYYNVAKQILGDSATEEDIGIYASLFEQRASDKELWNSNNDKFQDKWKKAKSKSKSNDPYEIVLTYTDMFEKDLTKGPLAVARDSNGSILFDNNGLPYLNDGDGMYYKDLYVGRYKTGLTRVPYDDYPALLHTGERVLTEREAEVYNSIIPDIVESATTDNYYRTNSNALTTNNTNIYGGSDIKDEISTQTESLSSILNKILQSLQNLYKLPYIRNNVGINQNILNMNSNVTQINTQN